MPSAELLATLLALISSTPPREWDKSGRNSQPRGKRSVKHFLLRCPFSLTLISAVYGPPATGPVEVCSGDENSVRSKRGRIKAAVLDHVCMLVISLTRPQKCIFIFTKLCKSRLYVSIPQGLAVSRWYTDSSACPIVSGNVECRR